MGVKKAPVKKAPVKKAPVKKAPVKKAPAKATSVAKAIKKAVKKAVTKAKKKAPKKTKCVCPPSKKALQKKKAAQKQKKEKQEFKNEEAMPEKQVDEVFKKLTSDDKDGKKEKNTPQLPKKAPAKKDAKKAATKKDAKQAGAKQAPAKKDAKKAPAKKVVAKKAPAAKKKTADDYADELYVLLQTESQFEFDWGDLKIPKVEPAPAKPVVKVLEGKLVNGIKGACQVHTVLHAAKKLACQRALEWCHELQTWGVYFTDMAKAECKKMENLHKEIVAGALKEFPFPVKKAPAKKVVAKKVVAKKAVKKAAKAIKKAAKKAAKKTGCVCPPEKKAAQKQKKEKKEFKDEEAMPEKQVDEVFKKLTSDDKDGKKEKNTPQLPKKAPAKKDAKKAPTKKDAKQAGAKQAPAKKVVAKKAPAKKADDINFVETNMFNF